MNNDIKSSLVLFAVLFVSLPVQAAAYEPPKIKLPGLVVTRIPLEKGVGRSRICYASGNSPFITLQGYVWNVRTGEKTSDFTVPFGVNVGRLAISPDGGYVAYEMSVGGSAEMKKIQAIDSQTGEIVCDCTTVGTASSFLQFAGPTKVVSSIARKMIVCDVQQNRIDLEFPIHAYTVSRLSAAISHKGRYLAVCEDLDILVYDLRTGKPVAKMAYPPAEDPQFTSVYGVTFSPDSQELAAVVQNRVVVWSNAGEVLADIELPPGGRDPSSGNLEWLLDKSGWLVDGYMLLDRETGLPLWTLAASGHFEQERLRRSIHLIDQNHLLLSLEQSRDYGELITTTIPWSKIRKAKAAGPTAANLPIKTIFDQ